MFLAGLTAISPELYEASICDGANRWQQTWHISNPRHNAVIEMTFILSVSGIVRDDFEQVYAIVGQNSELYETVDVIGSWMYRGLRGSFRNWEEVTAVRFVQSIVSFILMITANFLVKKNDNKGCGDMKYKLSKGRIAFNIFNVSFLVVLSLVFLLPYWLILSGS